jgi:predicted permease
VELWAPLLLDPARTWRGGHWFTMIARLSPGTSAQEAEADMAGIMASWRERYPDHHRGHFLYLTPLKDDLVADVRPTLLLLLGAVAFVLLIACANVATLLLARGASRHGEIAIRAALGAGRARLVRQLLTEALLLAGLGGVIGLFVASVGVDALLALEGGTLPRGQGIGIDVRVLVFTTLVVVLTTLTSGLVPAREATLLDPGRAFAGGGRGVTAGRRRVRSRQALVVTEVGVALVLLLGAGLMARSLWRTLRQDTGFVTRGLLTVSLTFPETGYTPQEKVDFMTSLADRVRQAPGVSGAGVTSRPPLLYDNSMTRFAIEGRPEVGPGEEGPTGSHVMASRSALEVLGVRALRGRLFDERDAVDGPPVALIDETMATRYWPGEDPVGRKIRFGMTDSEMRTIVGVVTPVRFDGLTMRVPTFYEPETQAVKLTPFHLGTMTLLVRAAGDPSSLAGTVRDAVRDLDPGLPILGMATMDDIIGGSVARPRFLLALLTAFAVLAVTLGAIGVYGVVAQGVSQRTNEIGVRRSLGARPRDVWRMIVGQELRPVAVGLAVGIGAAIAVSRLLAGFLFEVSPTDPWTYVLAVIGVAAVAGAATVVPARRATRIDPVEALRME